MFFLNYRKNIIKKQINNCIKANYIIIRFNKNNYNSENLMLLSEISQNNNMS